MTEAGQRFINGVVHDLIDKMVQSPYICGTDIHAGAFANRLKPFQHLNLILTIIFSYLGGLLNFRLSLGFQIFLSGSGVPDFF